MLTFSNSPYTPVARSAPGQEKLDKVWLDQIDLSLRLAPFTILTGLSVSIIVCFYFWTPSTMVYVIALQAGNFCLAGIALGMCVAWRNRCAILSTTPVRTLRRRLIQVSALAGLTLASIPVMLFDAADADGRLLIASTCAGLIATGMCIGFVPAAGVAYSSSIILGSFLALAMTGEPVYLVVAFLLAIYASFILATIAQISNLVGLRALVQIDLDRQHDLIGMLLNDFQQNASDWLWEIDATGLVQSPSKRFVDVAQTTAERLAGSSFAALVAPPHGDGTPSSVELLTSLRERRPFQRLRVPIRVAGERRWWSLAGKPVFDAEGAFVGFRGIGSDVTIENEYIAKLDYLANHDALTGLANRRRFEEIVAEADLVLAKDRHSHGYAVLCLDLDRFKQVNDTFGHAVGDELLRQVGKRLLAVSGSGALVSRFAGDEFAILHKTADVASNIALARRLVETLQTPFTVDGLYLDIGVSVGIAIADDAATSSEVLRKADAALYRMKESGRGGYKLYEPTMDAHKKERATLMGELHGALDRGEFSLHYQPLVSSTSGKLCGFEALMRWRHPLHGRVAPSEFIALAEETGTILALGEWGLRRACQFASTWQDRSLSIAVNVSTVQIRHCDLVGIVARALADSGLEASRLELEITETAFLVATNETKTVLEKLRKLGVCLALDDFGTGYSSLGYLTQLPVDKLKIDRSFIMDLPHVKTNVSIVKTIVELGRTLGMTTIAEGVETMDQRDCLRQMGCPQLQGYLFGKPADEAATLRMIARKSKRFEPRVVA